MDRRLIVVMALALLMIAPSMGEAQKAKAGSRTGSGALKLPTAKRKVGLSVEEALQKRLSTKAYLPRPVGKDKLAQVLWAMAGVNRPKEGKRTHPSPMAKYTVDVYVADGTGTYKYDALGHKLVPVPSAAKFKGGPRKMLPKKDYVKVAPVLIMLVGDVTRLPAKFPENMRWNWIHCEAGTMCQNLHLQCAALDLGTCVNAGFDGDTAKAMLGLKKGSKVLYVLPLGHPKK